MGLILLKDIIIEKLLNFSVGIDYEQSGSCIKQNKYRNT